MGDRTATSYRRRVLGRTLKELRELAKMSLEDAGRPIRISKAKLSRIENGQHPAYNDFMALLDRYGVIVNDYPRYVELYDRAKEAGWWRAFGLDDSGFVPVEGEASMVRYYELGYVPGILQAEGYMRETFARSRVPLRGKQRENAIRIRLYRKRRLTDEPLLTVHVVFDESALLRPPCDREQLEHIIELMKLPTVTVQVIPLSVGSHSGLCGDFVVFTFADPAEPDLAYVSYNFGSTLIEDEEEVRGARLLFDHLAGLALSEQETVALLEKMLANM